MSVPMTFLAFSELDSANRYSYLARSTIYKAGENIGIGAEGGF